MGGEHKNRQNDKKLYIKKIRIIKNGSLYAKLVELLDTSNEG